MTVRGAIVLAVLALAGTAMAWPRWHWIPRPRASAVVSDPYPFPTGVWAHWRFDSGTEFSNGVISDLSGHGYNATQSTVAARGDYLNPGILFQSGDAWFMPSASGPTGEFTIVACYNARETAARLQNVVAFSSYGTAAQWDQLNVYAGSPGTVDGYTKVDYNAANQVTLNPWSYALTNELRTHFLLFATNNCMVARDNLVTNAVDTSCSYYAGDSPYTPQYCVIGHHYTDYSLANTKVYEVAIWQRKLTMTEATNCNLNMKARWSPYN